MNDPEWPRFSPGIGPGTLDPGRVEGLEPFAQTFIRDGTEYEYVSLERAAVLRVLDPEAEGGTP